MKGSYQNIINFVSCERNFYYIGTTFYGQTIYRNTKMVYLGIFKHILLLHSLCKGFLYNIYTSIAF